MKIYPNLRVVGESHVLLAETNGVLALGDAVKLLESLLRDAPLGEVHLDGVDTDVGGAGGDVKGDHCDSGYRWVVGWTKKLG